MFVELPDNLVPLIGAFMLGWLLSWVGGAVGRRFKRSTQRDPRDDRIRSLEAELRVAQSASAKKADELSQMEERLKETTVGIERRDNVITEQQEKIERVAKDLKDSVIKTRELRAELAERATENVHAEAKIREVETELSVAQASQDLLATGVLDYRFNPDDDDSEGGQPDLRGASR